MDPSTVYHVRKRYEEDAGEGLEDRRAGRRRGVAKVDLRALSEVRNVQEDTELGAFRVYAALGLMGISVGPRTVGRILASNREAEGLEKREMPFGASHRHEYWTPDVRYLDHSIPETGQPTWW